MNHFLRFGTLLFGLALVVGYQSAQAGDVPHHVAPTDCPEDCPNCCPHGCAHPGCAHCLGRLRGALGAGQAPYGGPWHYGYYHVAWGSPVALVVPPTAESESVYNWGVGGTYLRPIYPQFGLGWPGPAGYGYPGCLRGTPCWPSSTDQFGVYYVRGPW